MILFAALACAHHAAVAHRWVVWAGEVRLLELSDTPGPLVDSNAPPPPPGVVLHDHPFLSGSCGGDALLCARAGQILGEATSVDAYLKALKAEGWRVEAVKNP